jgi:flagellar protein FlgJ
MTGATGNVTAPVYDKMALDNVGSIRAGEYDNRIFDRILDDALASGDDAELKEACKGVEAYFTQYALGVMRQTTFGNGGMFQKSRAEQIFTDMLYEEYAKQAAATNGTGMADMLYRQIKTCPQAKRAKESG